MLDLLIRIVVAAISLLITAFFTPGMNIQGLGPAIVAAIVMGLINWLLANYTQLKASPTGKGVSGFLSAALVIYLTKFFVSGFNVSIIGAIIGALIMGVVNAIIPSGKIFN